MTVQVRWSLADHKGTADQGLSLTKLIIKFWPLKWPAKVHFFENLIFSFKICLDTLFGSIKLCSKSQRSIQKFSFLPPV